MISNYQAIRGRTKYNIYSWPLFMILLAPFVMPEYFTEFNSIVTLYVYSRYASTFVLLVLGLLALRTLKESLTDIIPFVFYETAIVVSTYLNHGLISVALERAFTVLSITLLFAWGLRVSPTKFLRGSLTLFEVLAYLNLALIILHPEGLYLFGNVNTYHFLGHRNVMIRYLLPAICMALLYSYYNYQRITLRCWILIGAVYLSEILVWSAASLAIMAVIIILLMLFNVMRHYPRWLNFDTFFASSIVIFFGIVIFRMQHLFSYLIVDVLHKSLDLTGRTVLWDYTFEYIAAKPLIGYGLQPDDWLRAAISFGAPHNFYLEMLLQGGVFQIASMLLILIIISRRFRRNANNRLVQLLSIIFSGYFILWNFEPFWEYDSRLIYGVLAMAFAIGNLTVRSKPQQAGLPQ